jgi:DNA repair exonuclease SbcCD nuclease subunit
MLQPRHCLFISDIHLFHRRNSTADIVTNLQTYLSVYRTQKPLDLLVLGGDVFDRLVEFQSPDVHEACVWVAWLLELCSQANIRLRILEGTPRHDWGQSLIFDTIAKAMRSSVDMRYINTLCVEVMSDWDMSILYIPDEWTDQASKTYQLALEALANQGLTQVDIAVMHGMFQYQLPIPQVMPSVHNEHDYLKIVRYVISIGHVHTHSHYERILAQGSFDRLAHGEEEAKGGIECTLYPDGRYDWQFRENVDAKVFITIPLKFMTVEDSAKYLERKVRKLPKNSYVRLKAKSDHPAILAFDSLRQQFPFLNWSKLVVDEEVSESPSSGKLLDRYQGVTLTAENLPGLLLDRVHTRYDCTDLQKQVLERLLRVVI